MENIVLRMDDVGASTKRYEVYSKVPFGNFLFIKYLPYFRAWGRYRELSADRWKAILDLLVKENAKVSVGVTATWVTRAGELIPFPEMYPKQAELLKVAMSQGLLELI